MRNTTRRILSAAFGVLLIAGCSTRTFGPDDPSKMTLQELASMAEDGQTFTVDDFFYVRLLDGSVRGVAAFSSDTGSLATHVSIVVRCFPHGIQFADANGRLQRLRLQETQKFLCIDEGTYVANAGGVYALAGAGIVALGDIGEAAVFGLSLPDPDGDDTSVTTNSSGGNASANGGSSSANASSRSGSSASSSSKTVSGTTNKSSAPKRYRRKH